jgi:hypothetical protein
LLIDRGGAFGDSDEVVEHRNRRHEKRRARADLVGRCQRDHLRRAGEHRALHFGVFVVEDAQADLA